MFWKYMISNVAMTSTRKEAVFLQSKEEKKNPDYRYKVVNIN
jgi:hypothetical protein